MTEISSILAGVVLGVILGTVGIFLYIRFRVIQISGNLDTLIREAIKEVESEMIGVTVEKHNGVFFAYRESDRQFVAQGADITELRAAFRLAFPGKITYLAGGDEAAVSELKADMEASQTN